MNTDSRPRALGFRLIPAPDMFTEKPVAQSIFHWWEQRRLAYNLFVLANGLLSFLLLVALCSLPPHPSSHEEVFPEPISIIVAPIFVPIMVNIAYTAGPILNRLLGPFTCRSAAKVGPVLMRVGIGFSYFVIYLPTVGCALTWLADVFGHGGKVNG